MAQYMVQVAYSTSGWAAQVANPGDRMAQVAKMVKKSGGKWRQGWYTFGEYDLVAIVEFPDDLSMGAMAVVIAAGGAVNKFVTTPLISQADGNAMIAKAGEMTYAPPQ